MILGLVLFIASIVGMATGFVLGDWFWVVIAMGGALLSGLLMSSGKGKSDPR